MGVPTRGPVLISENEEEKDMSEAQNKNFHFVKSVREGNIGRGKV